VNDLPLATMCGADWIFYPSPDPFQNQQITTPLMGAGGCRPGDISLTLTSALSVATNQDFDAIAIGDCTGNWTPASGAFRLAAPSGATVHAGAVRAGRGHTSRLPIYVQSAAPFSALEVKLTYDPAVLRLRAVLPHGAAADALIGVHDDEAGTLTVTLASAAVIDGSSGPVLLVEFSNATATGDAALQLIQARVDDQPARLVNHAAR
jgi:hypothetical protein